MSYDGQKLVVMNAKLATRNDGNGQLTTRYDD